MAVAAADWIGRTRTVDAVLTPWPAQALHATLDLPGVVPAAGEVLPPLWSWLYFLDAAAFSELGEDGHPHTGGFLPPVDLPRRMWAGSSVEFSRPLLIGKHYQRTSTISDVAEKSGRSGRLCFVTVDHEVSSGAVLHVQERQTIVYREPPAPGAVPPRAEPSPSDATWRVARTADSRLLFRFSALTFNAHRIHYDLPYATGIEGYPGLVVHGPLQALLMLELVRAESNREIAAFEFQARQPLFAGQPFEVCAQLEGGEVAVRVQREAAVTAAGRVLLGESTKR